MVEYSKTTMEAIKMAKIKSLFSSKKSNTDGQEEYFKEDFPPVVNRPATKTEDEKPAQPKKTSTHKKPAAKKAASSNRVAPQPVEKIINPKAKKAAKPAAKVVKPTEAKKPATKVVKPAEAKKTTKKAAETKAASTAKKVAAKPAAKVEKPVAKKATASKKTTAKATNKKTATKAAKAQVAEELYDDSPEVKGAVAIQESKPSANGKWDIRRAKDGRFFFSLYASNHMVIAYSQIYSSQTAVTTGINSVIANAAKAETEDTTLKKSVSLSCPKWEIYLDKAEQYRFRLYAPNGLCICHSSHGYATKGGCKGGIESIKRFASEEASVNKLYLK